MITGWLIVNGFLNSEKFDELTTLFLRAAENEKVNLLVKFNHEILVDTVEMRMDLPEFVIFWDKDVLLAQWLEQQGVAVYNSSQTIAICDDKRKTHLALLKKHIPMPRTLFAPMSYEGIGFTNSKFLQEVREKLGFPLIVKEAFGSFGMQVYLANDFCELHDIVRRCKTTELIFQEYIQTSSGRDVRLQVVGGTVVGSMFRYSTNDFRANLTAGGLMKKYQPSCKEKQLAVTAACAVGADFAGVDLLFGEEQMLVCEVNSNAHFKNLQDCTGVDTARKIIHYVQKNIRGKGNDRLAYL